MISFLRLAHPLLILACLSLAMAACSKKPALINGQVFVVTQGGENIKMGAVPVRVIPEEQFKEIARTTATAIERQQALEDEHRAGMKVKAQLREELEQMKPKNLAVPALEVLLQEVREEQGIDGMQGPSSTLWVEAFARALPPTQIQTDADGRFTAEVASKVWLVAVGQRHAGGNSEDYLWVQPYEPPQEGLPQPILISNRDNMSAKEEFYTLVAPLLAKPTSLIENPQPKPSDAVVQWASKIKDQANKKVAEAKAKAEAERKERERLAAEAMAKAEAERKERERLAAEVRAKLLRQLQSGAVGSKFDLPLSTSVSAELCFIPSGSFMMGSPSGEEERASDERQVKVTLSQPFWLAKTEVTQAQWEAVMGSNPSDFKGEQLPVECVSWDDAQAFITKLNEKQILPQGWKFALPTEAQWEYACRAGEKGPYSSDDLDKLGWYDGNSEKKTHEVGQKKPNAWGLYDMHGNVWEWCADWYEDTLQGGVDPHGPSFGDGRVDRGGSWSYFASGCRATFRSRDYPGIHYHALGLRLAIVSSN